MKRNKTFEALTDIDDDLIKEAREISPARAAMLSPKRKALIALAAAVLAGALIISSLILGGAFRKDPGAETPSETTRTAELTPTGAREREKNDADYCFIEDPSLYGLDDSAAKESESYVGLRAIEVDGEPELVVCEYAALYKPLSRAFAFSRIGVWETLARWYPSGALHDGKLYFRGGIVGCIETGDGLERFGVFYTDCRTGATEPLLLARQPVFALAFHGDTLYFAGRGSLHSETVVLEDGGRWDRSWYDLTIYQADLNTKQISLLCQTGYAGLSGRIFFDAGEDGIVLTVQKDDHTTCLVKASYDGEVKEGIALPGNNYSCALTDGAVYCYSDAYAPETKLYKLNGDQQWELLFEDETPYPHTARVVGSTMDQPTFHEGKLVIVRDGELRLFDLETGEETLLKSGVSLENAEEKESTGAFDANLFSKCVCGGTLYFYDVPADTLYAFKDEAEQFAEKLDYLKQE